MVNGPPPPDGPWRRGSPPAPDILWDLFISFSPPHKKKSFYISTSKKFMVEMFFFRQNLLPWEGSDQMSAFWSMLWGTPFRNFSRKNTIFRKFRPVVDILSVSDGRPWGQGVCPSLCRVQATSRSAIDGPVPPPVKKIFLQCHGGFHALLLY